MRCTLGSNNTDGDGSFTSERQFNDGAHDKPEFVDIRADGGGYQCVVNTDWLPTLDVTDDSLTVGRVVGRDDAKAIVAVAAEEFFDVLIRKTAVVPGGTRTIYLFRWVKGQQGKRAKKRRKGGRCASSTTAHCVVYVCIRLLGGSNQPTNQPTNAPIVAV